MALIQNKGHTYTGSILIQHRHTPSAKAVSKDRQIPQPGQIHMYLSIKKVSHNTLQNAVEQ